MKQGSSVWSGLVVGFAIFITVPVGGRAHNEPAEPGEIAPDCGTLALYHLLSLEGRATSLTEIRSRLPDMPAAGYSMKELRDAARACGLHTFGLRLKDVAHELDRPMIAFLQQGHYIVVRPVGHTGKLAQILDGTRDSMIVDKAK